MRHSWPAVLLLLLGACLPGVGPAVDAPQAEAITVTPLDNPQGVEPEAEAPPGPAAATPTPADPATESVRPPAGDGPEPAVGTRLPPRLADQAGVCAAQGGTLRPRGQGDLWTCVRSTRDAGRACRTGAECEGLCLARSGSCAPVEPLFGCHDALDRAGRPQTVCRE